MAKLIVGINDIQTLFPECAKEWDYEGNYPETPDSFTQGSHKTVKWICPNHHHYSARIADRVGRHKSGCCYCAGKIPVIGENDLASQFPEIVREWDYVKNEAQTPETVTYGSNKKVYWVCSKCGYSFSQNIVNRTTRGDGCPKCGKLDMINTKRINIIQKDGSLADLYPNLANEWHSFKNGSLTPDEVTFSSHILAWWHCSVCGYEWQSKVNTRTSNKTGCPNCAKRLSTSFPEQAIYYYIKNIYPNSKNRYLFNNEFELDIYIPELSVAIEYDGDNWHKDVLKDKMKYQKCQANGIELLRIREEVTEISYELADYVIKSDYRKKNVETIDVCLEELFKYFHINADHDCKRDKFAIYEQYYTSLKEDTLDSKYPDIVAEWNYEKNNPLMPSMFKAGSNVKVFWKCRTCGAEWKAAICNRTKNNSGCPACFSKDRAEINRKASLKKGVNDLMTIKPDLAQAWDYSNNTLTPADYSFGSHAKVYWICETCGTSFLRTIKVQASTSKGVLCQSCCRKLHKTRKVLI